MKGSCCASHYSVYGLRIRVASDDPVLLRAVHSRLRHFVVNGGEPADLTFVSYRVAEKGDHAVGTPPEGARPVYEASIGDVLYSDAADQLFLNWEDRVRWWCDPGGGTVRVSILSRERDRVWLSSHPLFTLSLIEQLKRRGRYSLHAAGLCVDGRGLLLAGGSGAGKSTLAIALLRAGFGFLADDMVFLVSGPEGPRALAFPDEIDLADESVRFFPELCPSLGQPRPAGRPKRALRVEEWYEMDLVWECRPAVIVFPRVARRERSILKPMSRDEALLELAPNVLLTEIRSSQAHLDLLAELIRVVECYRLETGRDWEALPGLLRDLVIQTGCRSRLVSRPSLP